MNDVFRIFLVSSLGKVLQKHILVDSPNSLVPYPWVADGADIFSYDKVLYIPANPGVSYDKNKKDFFKEGLLGAKLDLKNGKVKYHIPYPNKDILEDKNFTSTAVTTKCAANENTHELIYSFAADPYVYRYDLSGKLKGKHLLKSAYIGDIKEISSKQIIGDPLEEAAYFMNNSFYGDIYYDRFRRLYYRLVKHKLTKEATKKEILQGRSIYEKYSMIVSDEDFNLLGEVMLKNKGGEGFEGNSLFIITKDGILIQSYDKSDENKMFFNQYKIVNVN